MTNEDKELLLKELWEKYNKICKDCGPGNGCDDCRGCLSAQEKFEIYKKIKSIEKI